MKQTIRVTINGRLYEEEVEPRILLAHFLHETIGLTGTHVGCVIQFALSRSKKSDFHD